MAWTRLHIDDVWKRFGDAEAHAPWILKAVSLEIEAGGFTCVLGPSGCGKTTLLNLIAGFEAPTKGRIALDERPIAGPGRDRAVIFQDVANALFPWLSAVENVEFGLRMGGMPAPAARERAMEFLKLVALNGDAAKFPYQLSGGMKQRVQIARALANDPAMLLMDEPFAALDAITRRDLQAWLVEIWQRTGKTIVFVTHDLMEALALGTRVVVLGTEASGVRGDFRIAADAVRSAAAPAFMKLHDEVENLIEVEVRKRRQR